MKDVLFFIGTMNLGGTEAKLTRSLLPLLKERKNINPKLLLLKNEGKFFDIIPSDIEKYCIKETDKTNLFNILPRFIKTVSEIKPDVIVSCMWYAAIISYLSSKLVRKKFTHIVHDTTNMTEYIKFEFGKEKYQRNKIYLIKKAYRSAEKIIVVSHGEKDDLVTNFGIPERLIKVIYNPINIDKIRKMSNEEVDIKKDKPIIITVGRLIYSKGHDILLNAFKKVREKIDCKLFIVGEGNERGNLETLRDQLKLKEDVCFLGFQHNPFKFMKYADLFCIATRYEGLCNSIIEAMVLGLPVIATDCKSGPSETLEHGKYGILVPAENSDALASEIIKVLTNTKLRENLSMLSLKRAEYYNYDKLLPEWERILLRR